jgi:hypothetical protein
MGCASNRYNVNAGTIAGFVRDALEGDQRMGILFERAKRQRLIEEV